MMDDEGTVVYFRTSPALEQQFSNDFAFNEDNGSPESNENDNSLSPAPPEGIGGVWQRSMFYFSDVVTRYLKITPDFSRQDDECCRDISIVIRDSPLLTEEDYQLLYFALLKPRPQRILFQEESLGIISTSGKGAVFASVLAVCWVTQLSLPVSLLLMVLLVLLGCARPVVTSAVSTSHERSLRKARQTVSDYCREVESLLSLLSLCLRTVHEAEMATRQFTRSH
ncbi:hypothetical protein GBAR_LOCUS20706 [Geodia barretti]|uniref:Uncharacterized protein n=1 Tax=Geodia barretti TaxID=519541 RepID=A0AA35X202_GEOBA|nr:hypothetical protein GBAR_LOCUS20706 [Geodia barretti]